MTIKSKRHPCIMLRLTSPYSKYACLRPIFYLAPHCVSCWRPLVSQCPSDARPVNQNDEDPRDFPLLLPLPNGPPRRDRPLVPQRPRDGQRVRLPRAPSQPQLLRLVPDVQPAHGVRDAVPPGGRRADGLPLRVADVRVPVAGGLRGLRHLGQAHHAPAKAAAQHHGEPHGVLHHDRGRQFDLAQL